MGVYLLFQEGDESGAKQARIEEAGKEESAESGEGAALPAEPADGNHAEALLEDTDEASSTASPLQPLVRA